MGGLFLYLDTRVSESDRVVREFSSCSSFPRIPDTAPIDTLSASQLSAVRMTQKGNYVLSLPAQGKQPQH